MTPELLKEIIEVVSTHTEHEGSYCDTGDSEEWFCRSHCTKLAVERLMAKYAIPHKEEPVEMYKCQSIVRGGKVENCTCGECF